MSMASHELKTPVTTIKMLVQILEEQYKYTVDPILQEYLRTIGQQVNQLTKLVTDLLDVSKIKADKFALEEKIIDFDQLVRGTVKDCQLLSPHHTLSIEGETHMQVMGDANNISRIFINLITNGIKYSPKGDRIIAHLTHVSDEVRVGIQDFGIGISEENRLKIFERFYQVGNERGQSFSGLGIGLYISAGIATQHGGRIWVESAGANLGSTFFLALPIYTPTIDSPEQHI